MFLRPRITHPKIWNFLRTTKPPHHSRIFQVAIPITVRMLSKTSYNTASSKDQLSAQAKYNFPYPSVRSDPIKKIKDLASNHDEKMLKITWDDGSQSPYPFIYLRDNCRCKSCCHESCQQRLILTMNLDINIKPTECSLSSDSETVSIVWPDGHNSSFTSNWLFERRFPEKQDTVDLDKRKVHDEDTVLWDSSLTGHIPKVDFHEVMENDLTMFYWMEILSKLGMVLLVNAPTLPGQLLRLTKHVGYIKDTNYGEVFEVYSKNTTTNLAYTSNYLQLHVDLPFFEYQPGVQLLHCIEQHPGKGGANHLVDGFNVAQQLRDIDPEGYKLMCTIPLTFIDVGNDDYGEYYMRYTRPPIEVDYKGNIKSISFNNSVRDSILKLPVEKVHPMYQTWLKMVQLMYNPNNILEKKLKPGEILVFHNRRILHGRTAYDTSQAGSRWLQGVYYDWDCIHSKMRVIANKHNLKTHIWS